MPQKQSSNPTNSAASSSSNPYPSSPSSARRPKSTRQQFSACGACRMRRVKCDLKDHYDAAIAQNILPTCSNCRERNLKCVDEYADIKTVKLLRRGRRLQQVEAVYGNQGSTDLGSPLSPVSPSQTQFPFHSAVPALNPDFFQSSFFRRFHIQRPLIDPQEFVSRYKDYYSGTEELSSGAQLIAMLLVVWAASYGVDESGMEEPHGGHRAIQQRKTRCNEMVIEVLRYVDMHGILRKPTWDGVRGLLLLLPLTEEVQSPMDRLVMYESTISQVYTLCSLGSMSGMSNPQGSEYGHALVRARIFWYAYVHEGITTGLRGGRLYLDHDDLETFQRTLPPLAKDLALSATTFQYTFAYQLAMAPVRLATACRQVHTCLTGPRARQKRDIDEGLLRTAWESIERCWLEFEEFRELETPEHVQQEDLDRFVSGWQIFIFECYNIIREALKQRITAIGTARISPTSPHNSPTSAVLRTKLERLHTIAEAKCVDGLRNIVPLVRHHLGSPFFEYDASLTRDGVFFSSFLLAEGHGSEEDLNTCIEAMLQYRWAFCKSEEREQTLRVVQDNSRRNSAYAPQRQQREPSGSPPSNISDHSNPPAIYPAGPMGRSSSSRLVGTSRSSPMLVSGPPSHGSPISVEAMPINHPSTRMPSRSSTRSSETQLSSAQGSRASPAGFTTTGDNSNAASLSIITTFPTSTTPSRMMYPTEFESQYSYATAPASNPFPSGGGERMTGYTGPYHGIARSAYSAPPSSIPMGNQHVEDPHQPGSGSYPSGNLSADYYLQ